jgi:hypothetical protein
MKITRENLLAIIQEEMAEAQNLLDPDVPLTMSKELEMFIEEVLTKAQQELGITGDDEESDEIYSLLLTIMVPGSDLSDIVAEELADLYRSGKRGKHSDPLDYRE